MEENGQIDSLRDWKLMIETLYKGSWLFIARLLEVILVKLSLHAGILIY